MDMERREIVRRAIEFRTPPRLPFWQSVVEDVPNDVCDCWEMDRQRAGWFFGNGEPDDWGCQWAVTGEKNMGQVVDHPLKTWDDLKTWTPPNPLDPFYYERIEDSLQDVGDRYVVLSCHFNLIERFHMLRGFEQAFLDLILEPERTEKLLDVILEFKLAQFDELKQRFGDRIDGLFLTDDWGTQAAPLISPDLFAKMFLPRYRKMVDAVHANGWHFMFHSCGRVNDLVPYFIDAGMDVLNLQQPQAYGLESFGRQFAGKTCFLTTVDIQATMPTGDLDAIREEARQLVEHWSTPKGGLIVFNYGDEKSIGTTREATEAMFREFDRLKYRDENLF